MKRDDALRAITFAAYHGDLKTAVLVYVEHRISRKVFNDMLRRGQQLKAAGARCDCWECRQKQQPNEA